MTTVLIVDDHPLLRRGLAEVIRRLPGYVLCAEAGDGRQALEAIREHRPEVVLLDVSMPGVDGLEVLAQAATWPSRPTFVMLTMHNEYVARALELGAWGYLLKEDAVTEIEDCLAAISAGRRYLSKRLPPGSHGAPTSDAALAQLTPAERRVLRLVAQHLTSREIAEVLSVSHRTVQNHRAGMSRKLGLTGSGALLRFALAQREALDRG